MSGTTNGVWTKDGEQITGRWWYTRYTDTFHIILDEKCRITGQRIELHLKGYEHPEFNGWKLVR